MLACPQHYIYTVVHTNNYNCYSASLLQCLLVHSIIYYTAVHTNNYNCYSASLLHACLSTSMHTNNYNCLSFITSMFACPALYITQQCIQIIIIVTVHPSLLQCLLVHSIIYYTAVHTNNYNCYSASLLQCLLVHSIIYTQ